MHVTQTSSCSMYGEFDENKQFCAKAVGKNYPWNGDAGGAFIQAISNPTYPVLIGILSGGPKNDATGDIPVVYTRVNSYINWIEQNTNIVFD